jgi:broad-specificity NMP kinase
MMCGITGTPGTGKTSVGGELRKRGHPVLSLSDTVRGYILERDEIRDTLVIDEEAWARDFVPVEGFVEGHLAHLLPRTSGQGPGRDGGKDRAEDPGLVVLRSRGCRARW